MSIMSLRPVAPPQGGKGKNKDSFKPAPRPRGGGGGGGRGGGGVGGGGWGGDGGEVWVGMEEKKGAVGMCWGAVLVVGVVMIA